MKEVFASRNPFLSRAGFDKLRVSNCKRSFSGRNPFLSRAGFDQDVLVQVQLWAMDSRNPFLSRAGFDGMYELCKSYGFDLLGRNPFLSRAGFDT